MELAEDSSKELGLDNEREVKWQVTEHSAIEMIDDPRLTDDEKREFLWYIEVFGPDAVVRKYIPSDHRVATATEILSSNQALDNPIQ